MSTGTIKFEPYRATPYRTAFFTELKDNLADDTSHLFTEPVFTPMSVGESTVPTTDAKVRSYELYIDEDSTSPGEFTRLAKTTTDADATGDYDALIVSATVTDGSETADAFEVTIKNISGATAAFKLVLVCDVA